MPYYKYRPYSGDLVNIVSRDMSKEDGDALGGLPALKACFDLVDGEIPPHDKQESGAVPTAPTVPTVPTPTPPPSPSPTFTASPTPPILTPRSSPANPPITTTPPPVATPPAKESE